MESVKQFITRYLNTNLKSLQSDYPGIQLNRLLNEFCDYSGLRPEDLYLQQSNDFIISLSKGYPLEYIQKKSYFYRSSFFVDERVLIPRSETEILVEDSVEFITKNYSKDFSIAEIGVGSFCLGLSILCELRTPVSFWGGDICDQALTVAKLNAFRLSSKIHKETNIELELRDRLSDIKQNFDLIVSNPPYIKENKDFKLVHKQANEFEPHLALYLKDDEYEQWFIELFSQASSHLKRGGAFFMEGHENSLEELKAIASRYFSKVIIKNDYTGRMRFLYAYK